jgi:hypothetical protein
MRPTYDRWGDLSPRFDAWNKYWCQGHYRSRSWDTRAFNYIKVRSPKFVHHFHITLHRHRETDIKSWNNWINRLHTEQTKHNNLIVSTESPVYLCRNHLLVSINLFIFVVKR